MKPADERGKYLNPEVYGMPETASMTYDAQEEMRRAAAREARAEHKPTFERPHRAEIVTTD